MYVQYILRNESNKPLIAKFAVESNITNISFGKKEDSGFSIESAGNEQVYKINTELPSNKNDIKSKLNNIQTVRISDLTNGISFVFEPNEKCSYSYIPLFIKRAGFDSENLQNVNQIAVSSLWWDINIEPGRETEKSINFTIIPVKKIKK